MYYHILVGVFNEKGKIMHFEKLVKQKSPDPRARTYYVFKCSICKHEHQINWVANLDVNKLIKCSNCGVIDDTNDKEYLIKQKHTLEQHIKFLQDEIMKDKSKLESVSAKLEEVTNVSVNN